MGSTASLSLAVWVELCALGLQSFGEIQELQHLLVRRRVRIVALVEHQRTALAEMSVCQG